MRHKVAGFKLKRDLAAPQLAAAQSRHQRDREERVITTVPKAKAVKPLVDKMITLGKARHAARAPAGRAFLHDPGLGEEAVR